MGRNTLKVGKEYWFRGWRVTYEGKEHRPGRNIPWYKFRYQDGKWVRLTLEEVSVLLAEGKR